jgi:hypothetical protein
MSGPDGRGERGSGDPFRPLWLEGNIRPPFCTRQYQGIGERDVGCRYCWPETCLWEQAQLERGLPIDAPIAGTSGRHRTPPRVGPFRSLLRMHRMHRRERNEDNNDG